MVTIIQILIIIISLNNLLNIIQLIIKSLGNKISAFSHQLLPNIGGKNIDKLREN